MHSFLIVVFIIIVTLLIRRIKSSLGIEVLRYIGGFLPLAFLILGWIENDGFTVIFVAISFFWFPIMSAKKENY